MNKKPKKPSNRYGSADAMAGRAPKKVKPFSSEGVNGNRITSSSSWVFDSGNAGYVSGPMKTSDALVKTRTKKAPTKKPAIDFGPR